MAWKQVPEIGWLEAADNPWGIRVLDVRPVTLNVLSTSTDPHCASNAVSFGQDDGTSFIGEEPPVSRTAQTSLRFPIDRVLADGVLFPPSEMEHKWALFYHRGQIICVRSWLRKVQVVARVEQRQDRIEITQVRGSSGPRTKCRGSTIRVLDYPLRSHALGIAYPAPLPAGLVEDPKAAAIWCMSMFGNRGLFATPYEFGEPTLPAAANAVITAHRGRSRTGISRRRVPGGWNARSIRSTPMAWRRFIGRWRASIRPSWLCSSNVVHRSMSDPPRGRRRR